MRILPFDPPTNWQSTTVKEERERERERKLIEGSVAVGASIRSIHYVFPHALR